MLTNCGNAQPFVHAAIHFLLCKHLLIIIEFLVFEINESSPDSEGNWKLRCRSMQFTSHLIWSVRGLLIPWGLCLCFAGQVQIWFELDQRRWLDTSRFLQSGNGQEGCRAGICSGTGTSRNFGSEQSENCTWTNSPFPSKHLGCRIPNIRRSACFPLCVI